MNDALREIFRHNAWGNQFLLEYCRSLTDEQLNASSTGTVGSILETFNHIIGADASYLRRLSGITPKWLENETPADLNTLAERADQTAEGWDRFLRQPVEAERVLEVNDGAYQVHAGVIIAQAIHHGNHHREQICAILTGLSVDPPDVQPWAYADATGRSRQSRV
jgi:uncharacterized damage-inducible protein DinB